MTDTQPSQEMTESTTDASGEIAETAPVPESAADEQNGLADRLDALKAELNKICQDARLAADHLEQRLRVGARFIQACQEQSTQLDTRAGEFEQRMAAYEESSQAIGQRIQSAGENVAEFESRLGDALSQADETRAALEQAIEQASQGLQADVETGSDGDAELREIAERHDSSILELRQDLDGLAQHVRDIGEQEERNAPAPQPAEHPEPADHISGNIDPEEIVSRFDHALTQSVAPLLQGLDALHEKMNAMPTERVPEHSNTSDLMHQLESLLQGLEARILARIDESLTSLEQHGQSRLETGPHEPIIRSCVDAINTNSSQAIELFIQNNYAASALQERSAKHRAEVFQILYDRTGGLTLTSIEPDATGCHVYAVAARTGSHYCLAFTMTNEQRILGVRMDPVHWSPYHRTAA